MGVILGEAPDAHKAVQRAAALVPIYGAEFGPPYRQIAITTNIVLEHQAVERAIHRSDLVYLILDVHLIEHTLCVEVEVARGFPKFKVSNVGTVDEVVALAGVLILPKVFDFGADSGALGMPEDKSSAGIFLNTKQIQLLPQHPMIPLLRLLHHLLISLQLLRILPRRGVYPLQHLPILVSPPVRSRHALQSDRLLGQLTGRFHVRPRAQVPPFLPNGVNRDGFRFDGIEDFELERLVY
mmetsp:Transcript_31765/g.68611  ORF Transcript_31765/g.68611 Transcript_31765/m.68611 type:complete len:239 (+) Transcript_31765:848-1564(+)